MKTHDSRPDSDPSVIELVPAPGTELGAPDHARRLAAAVSRLAARFAGLAVLIVLGLIVLRFVGVALVHHQLAGGAEEFSRVAGIDRRLADWLSGIVSWTASLAMIGLFGPFILAFFWPFAAGLRLWKPALILLAVSGLGAGAPVAVKAIRGVDDSGLPARMSEVDPATVNW
ncbi:MAG: hypothetical protein KDM91_20425, partial [Verrucomicrobiae bacterium]|nr:hypothetical protein [Verrucomicrobiae bacterium]